MWQPTPPHDQFFGKLQISTYIWPAQFGHVWPGWIDRCIGTAPGIESSTKFPPKQDPPFSQTCCVIDFRKPLMAGTFGPMFDLFACGWLACGCNDDWSGCCHCFFVFKAPFALGLWCSIGSDSEQPDEIRTKETTADINNRLTKATSRGFEQ